jgi:hypothetical protein
MDGWLGGWIDGRTDGRTDGWMDGWKSSNYSQCCVSFSYPESSSLLHTSQFFHIHLKATGRRDLQIVVSNLARFLKEHQKVYPVSRYT